MADHSWGAPRRRLAAAVLAMVALVTLSFASAHARAAVGRLGPAPAAQRLSLVLPLSANLAGLQRFAAAVTTPGSPLYGDYETIPELARRFGATTANRARVLSFLRGSGATSARIDRTGLFAEATMPVAAAERVFGTALARYQSGRSTRYVAPTGSVHLPLALRDAATGVVGLDTRPLVDSQPVTAPAHARFARTAKVSADNIPSGYGERSGSGSGCTGALAQRGFTPNQYLTAYDYAALHSSGVGGQGERVALVEIDGYNYDDLTSFASCFGLGIPAITAYGVNLSHPLAPGGESTLDLEVLDTAAPDLKSIDVYETAATASGLLRGLTAPLQNGKRVPEVMSASLGTCEPALQLSVGTKGVRSAEGALAVAAAAGISVLASSGDAGSSSCIGHDGPIDALAVSYPASSPWVTGVGGTNVELSGANQIVAQLVWNDAPEGLAAGGGGPSGLFYRPSYQKGFMKANRRGVPDVSMLADVLPGYDIYCTAPECLAASGGDPWVAVGGTSAASPLLAGGFALVDELLREHHRQNLGLANGLLYYLDRHDAKSGVFADISGSDDDLGPYLPSGGGRSLGCCTATPGYDLASGLGSVDLAKFALLAVVHQPRVADVGLSLPHQNALSRGYVQAHVTCSRRCILTAAAIVPLGGQAPVLLGGREYPLLKKGSHTVRLYLSRAQHSAIRKALRAHQKVRAHVSGEVVDSGGNVEATTKPRLLSL